MNPVEIIWFIPVDPLWIVLLVPFGESLRDGIREQPSKREVRRNPFHGVPVIFPVSVGGA